MLKLEDKMIRLLYTHEKAILEKKGNEEILQYEAMLNNDHRQRELVREENYGVNRLVVMLTHQCQLNCRYCMVRKFKDTMSKEILFRSIDVLFTSIKSEVQLQFFGGEPLLKYDLLQAGVEYATKVAKKKMKKIQFIITTNGLALTDDKLIYLKDHNFHIEFSIDGDKRTQLKNRKSRTGIDYYSLVISHAQAMIASGISYKATIVVPPRMIPKMMTNVRYLLSLGFKVIQVNYNLGVYWSPKDQKRFFDELNKVRKSLKRKNIVLVNDTYERKEPAVLNTEMTVDCQGDVFMEAVSFIEKDFERQKKVFGVGHIRAIQDINVVASNSYENYKTMVQAYKDKPQFRKIILSNIEIGYMSVNKKPTLIP